MWIKCNFTAMENIIEIDGKRYKVTLHECEQPKPIKPKAPTTIEELTQAAKAAQHAAAHFWHLFQDFYMLEDKQ